jgi:hypothetical protein
MNIRCSVLVICLAYTSFSSTMHRLFGFIQTERRHSDGSLTDLKKSNNNNLPAQHNSYPLISYVPSSRKPRARQPVHSANREHPDDLIFKIEINGVEHVTLSQKTSSQLSESHSLQDQQDKKWRALQRQQEEVRCLRSAMPYGFSDSEQPTCTNSVVVYDMSRAVCYPGEPRAKPMLYRFLVKIPFTQHDIRHHCYGKTELYTISWGKMRKDLISSLPGFAQHDFIGTKGCDMMWLYEGLRGYEVTFGDHHTISYLGNASLTGQGIWDTPSHRPDTVSIKIIALPTFSLRSYTKKLKILWCPSSSAIRYLIKDSNNTLHEIWYGARRTIFCDTSGKKVSRYEDTIRLGNIRNEIASNKKITKIGNELLQIRCVERLLSGKMRSVSSADKYYETHDMRLNNNLTLPYAPEKYSGSSVGSDLMWLVSLVNSEARK